MNGISFLFAPAAPIGVEDNVVSESSCLSPSQEKLIGVSSAGDSHVQALSHRPKLEPPLGDANKWQKGVDELSKSFGANANTAPETNPIDPNLAEIKLFRSLIACIIKEQSLMEESAEITLQLVQQREEANKKIKQEYFNKLKEQIAEKKKSHVLKWVNFALYGALAIVGAASIALTLTAVVPSAGAAIPLAITITMGVLHGALSAAKGAASIYQGVLKYNSKKMIGELETLKWKRYLNTEKIKSGIEEMRQSMEEIADYWQQLFTIVSNQHRAKRINI